jgi:transcriptional regulator with XRE-family HTH domain
METRPRANGSKIEDWRWRRHLRTTELAERAGISRQYLNRILRGKRGASLEVQEAIADALGVPVEEIQDSES